jgi:hypothetical protein
MPWGVRMKSSLVPDQITGGFTVGSSGSAGGSAWPNSGSTGNCVGLGEGLSVAGG